MKKILILTLILVLLSNCSNIYKNQDNDLISDDNRDIASIFTKDDPHYGSSSLGYGYLGFSEEDAMFYNEMSCKMKMTDNVAPVGEVEKALRFKIFEHKALEYMAISKDQNLSSITVPSCLNKSDLHRSEIVKKLPWVNFSLQPENMLHKLLVLHFVKYTKEKLIIEYNSKKYIQYYGKYIEQVYQSQALALETLILHLSESVPFLNNADSKDITKLYEISKKIFEQQKLDMSESLQANLISISDNVLPKIAEEMKKNKYKGNPLFVEYTKMLNRIYEKYVSSNNELLRAVCDMPLNDLIKADQLAFQQLMNDVSNIQKSAIHNVACQTSSFKNRSAVFDKYYCSGVEKSGNEIKVFRMKSHFPYGSYTSYSLTRTDNTINISYSPTFIPGRDISMDEISNTVNKWKSVLDKEMKLAFMKKFVSKFNISFSMNPTIITKLKDDLGPFHKSTFITVHKCFNSDLPIGSQDDCEKVRQSYSRENSGNYSLKFGKEDLIHESLHKMSLADAYENGRIVERYGSNTSVMAGVYAKEKIQMIHLYQIIAPAFACK